MLLTVIIVSYEVKYFLEQCLFSVKAAVGRLEEEMGSSAEIIVVDNNSQDGTVDYLRERFPLVKFYRNKENIGFGRANNLGLQQAKGDFILFLNPDTIIPENIFSFCIGFFQSHPSTGAIGVRMIDGHGKFLPESKRGFPTAWRSFSKLSGLSSLFPTTRTFAGYNMGHLDEKEIFSVEALAGAFMMTRKELVVRLGGFDEQFFMYAEDIDLSKRIRDIGFENYYLGKQVIIHFKGESTSKDVHYVKIFYDAMNLYVQKHYKGFTSRFGLSLMKAGIAVRRSVARLSIKKQQDPLKLPALINFLGDGDEIEVLKKRLPGLKVVNDAAHVVICQGPQFSFMELIRTVENLKDSKNALLHAAGSSSLVGSFDKDWRGLAISVPG